MLPHLGSLPSWAGARRVAIDIETRDPDLTTLGPGVRTNGYIVGVSFAIDDGTPNGPAYYLPVRHQGGGNYHNPEQVFAYLREQGRRFRGILAGAGLQYDLDYLAQQNVLFRPRFYRDIQVSGPLLVQPVMQWRPDEETGKLYLAEVFPLMGLEAQCKRAEIAGKDETQLTAWAAERKLDPKKDLWRMPAELVTDYAVQDVRAPLQLLKKHEREIDEQNLWPVYDLESRLLPVLVKMRRRGVRVNPDKLEQIEDMATRKEAVAMREVSRLSGILVTPADTTQPEALAKCLKTEGHKIPLTPKTKKSSVKAEWLRSLKSPIANAILEAKRWNKIRGTFCNSIRVRMINGRIHPTFNQLKAEADDGTTKGVGFGRCSSSNPNIQQQPARDPEIGPLWRSIYLPDEGGTWACLDFSSQEPRWITHYAELVANDSACRWDNATKEAARAAAHACRADPDWDNHSMMATMMYGDDFTSAVAKHWKHLRTNAKTIFLGLCYGMGGGKLCSSLGLPTIWGTPDWAGGRSVELAGPEGQALLDRFDARVPHVRALAKSARLRAEKIGYILTVLGRRCRFPRHPQSGRVEHSHKAGNRLIQGTSADQTKLAMVEADDAGIDLQTQVHDELNTTIYDPREAVQLGEIMCSVVHCNVPTIVDNEQGPSWGELKAA